ncbi:Protein of unknown function (DUF1064) [Desulfitobacterium hafniense]|uniref:DUF1064 domain-containing protein n=1 Tax=Desulfitobacterium hafniense TaxID=49338 RepID=A0A098AW56_DESHA|nr:DUF1064 domain-containing protein [Desulfitobacterium hafniense]CDV96392.1 Protein of unknown function (DUF1064) [Desulfitobacterium hafniense]
MTRTSKYNAKRVQVAGKVFDSKAEANRYRELLLLMKTGEVAEVECQPRFLLQEGFRKNGKTHRPIYYIADFLVKYADGHTEVEDVKGVKTEVFRIKQKMFEKRYPEYSLKIV